MDHRAGRRSPSAPPKRSDPSCSRLCTKPLSRAVARAPLQRAPPCHPRRLLSTRPRQHRQPRAWRLPGLRGLSVGSGAIGIQNESSLRALRPWAIPRRSDAVNRRAGPETETAGVGTGGVTSAPPDTSHDSIRLGDHRSQSLAALRIMAHKTLSGGQRSASCAESRHGPVLRRLCRAGDPHPPLRRLCRTWDVM